MTWSSVRISVWFTEQLSQWLPFLPRNACPPSYLIHVAKAMDLCDVHGYNRSWILQPLLTFTKLCKHVPGAIKLPYSEPIAEHDNAVTSYVLPLGPLTAPYICSLMCQQLRRVTLNSTSFSIQCLGEFCIVSAYLVYHTQRSGVVVKEIRHEKGR